MVGRSEDHDQRKPLAIIFEPHCTAQKNDEPGQAIGSDERGRPGSAASARALRRLGSTGKPVKTIPRSHSVIAQAPPSTSDQHHSVVAAEPPADASRDGRIDREVDRKQDDRDPAEPRRHVRLVGEGRRDPVEADRELTEAERPADEDAQPQGSCCGRDSSHSDRERDEQQRPPADRLEGEGRHCAGEKRVKNVEHYRCSHCGELTATQSRKRPFGLLR